ncbi:MAG TPA: DUF4349 domain-containing protein [Solirubrobacterales bacterium]|nr:DUF4349 domain-containing protein [Solirubrobacterales bacterium]
MDRFRDDAELTGALTALRPTPRPAFAAELDERAAAGFPRRAPEDSAAASPLAWVRSLRPGQILMPVGATALVAIVLTTAVVAVEEGGSDGPAGDRRSVASELSQGPLVKPDRAAKRSSEPATGGATAAAEAAQPSVQESEVQVESSAGAPGISFESSPRHRDVERAAEMVLGVEAAKVGDASSEVFAAVHANRGIVIRSSTSAGSAGDASASFELLIPSGRLGDALAAFSRIGEVRSRREATADITAPTVTAAESLQDSRARIDGLLAQLSEAATDSEREAVEAELRGERRRSAALRARLANLDRRASLSRVSVRIQSGGAPASSDDSSWGPGDALGDAGHILGIAAGVTLIALAVLGPIAMIVLLAWLAHRTIVRRSRERALG